MILKIITIGIIILNIIYAATSDPEHLRVLAVMGWVAALIATLSFVFLLMDNYE